MTDWVDHWYVIGRKRLAESEQLDSHVLADLGHDPTERELQEIMNGGQSQGMGYFSVQHTLIWEAVSASPSLRIEWAVREWIDQEDDLYTISEQYYPTFESADEAVRRSHDPDREVVYRRATAWQAVKEPLGDD